MAHTQAITNLWLYRNIKKGDLVYCVRQPSAELYLGLVRAVHRRGAEDRGELDISARVPSAHGGAGISGFGRRSPKQTK